MNVSKIRDLHFLSSIRCRTAKQGLYSHLKFRRFEWFRQIVVGTGLESLHFVIEFAARSEHQDRGLDAVFAKVTAHIKSASRWKHDVEDNKIECFTHRSFLCNEAVSGAFHGIALRSQ